ncbi:choice-of-anchor D domain-containing protein [Candidatus Nomurabacteria bacterium]|nr:choice-of-anchor D domain-containing protein [Candidatus Nomurabacteria bacterium]
MSGWLLSFVGIDDNSDAVRDLNFDPGVYLFGGWEGQIPNNYHCKDVNANGAIDNYCLTGLNYYFPEDICRTWIVSSYLGLPNDGVVTTNSQFLTVPEDTIMAHRHHLFAPSESKDYFALLRGLDEPSEKGLAYKIDTNSTTKGFITFQRNMNPNDVDLFEVDIPRHSSFSLKLLANTSTGINLIELLNDDLSQRKNTTNMYGVPLIDTLEEGTYYIRITGTATNNSYQYPYTLTTTTTLIPPSSLVASPGDKLEYYDVVVNENRDKAITLTNNASNTISVSNMELTGPEANQFAIIGSTSLDIPSLGSADIIIRCNPTDTGVISANLVITNTSTDAPTISIPLHGVGVDSATRRLIVSPDISFNYGNVTNMNSRIKTFKLKNTGSNAIAVTGVSLTGMNIDSYSIINPPNIPFYIETGEVAQVNVKFLPTDIGVKSANLVLASDADNASPEHTITLYGNGKNSIYTGIYNTIVAYEYWFDESYSSNVYTEVTPQQVFTLNSSLSTTELNTGLHQFHFRAKDNKGKWGSVITEVFYKLPLLPAGTRKIVAYEYWFDNDYDGKESVNTIPQQIHVLDSAINTGSLSAGLHNYHIRYKDDAGSWSSIVSEVFYKMPVVSQDERKITSYEYWFDNAYSSRISTAVSPQLTYTLNSSLDASLLPSGLHNFHTRFRDDAGQWSSVVSEVFYKLNVTSAIPNLISEYRYWFDMDNSSMTSVSLPTPVNPYQLIRNITVCSLPIGSHVIHFQFKDTRQYWSSVVSETFEVISPAAPSISPAGPISICQGNSITLTSSSSSSYSWNTGETTRSIEVSSEGEYYVTATNACGSSLISETTSVISHLRPVAVITGMPNSIIGEQGVTYSTDPTMSNYLWHVSPGGIITSGQGTSSITVDWQSGGDQAVSVSFNDLNGCTPEIPIVFPVTVGNKRSLNLTVFLEGLASNETGMRKARNESGEQFAETIADKITVELHSSLMGDYSNIRFSTGLIDLDISGNIVTDIPAIYHDPYYITIRHRNSIETTTANPVSFQGEIVEYDFTNSINSAYGNNLKLIYGRYCIYGGDVNQDGVVDGSDMSMVDNDATSILRGYFNTDANGDGIVDATDMALIDNNSTGIIRAKLP